MAIPTLTRNVFDVNKLNLWYGDHHALKDIDFPIIKKEVTAMIGPSGCGKSTFIKSLNLMINMLTRYFSRIANLHSCAGNL